MNDLTYELWRELIEYIASECEPLFSIMHEVAGELPLSRDLIDDLKKRNEITISDDPWKMQLQIDPIDDDIGGFRVYLMASIELDAMNELMKETEDDLGVSPEEIDAFEVEHGLDMLGDIFEEIRDKYQVQPEIQEGNIIFSLVVFDSQDIDDSKGNDIFWSDEVYTN